jgi:acyl-coenzyme A thioesterase PaaI-like protein
MTNDKENPAFGGVALPGMGDDEVFSFAEARERLGETFAPIPVPAIPPADPDLDRAVAELRRLLDATAALAHSEVELGDIADRLAEVADMLEPRVPSEQRRLETMWTGAATRRSNPVAGPENPIAPPMEFFGCDDGTVMAEATLGPVYQGPPGCVHGGVSALIIDHMMGLANHWAGRFGMTAHYEVDYRKPTPLLTPLTFRAWAAERDGRKTWTNATVHAGDVLCVEARGLFLEAGIPVPGQPESTWNKGDAS